MAELKTKPTRASVRAFLDGIADPDRRRDAKAVARIMKRVTGEPPRMWGSAIVGYGTYDYRYESGRSGTWMRTGFSPRKQALTVYVMGGFRTHASLLKRLGKHSTGKSCLYIKRLEDVDLAVLEQLIADGWDHMAELYP